MKPFDQIFDIRSEEALFVERHQRLISRSHICRLLFGFESVNEEIIEGLRKLSVEKEVVSKMKSVQAGAVMNRIIGYPSEERQVTHMRCRDPQDPFSQKELQRGIEFAKKSPFRSVVVVGIGGSNLGTEAIYYALGSYTRLRELYFIANIDPRNSEEVLNSIDLKESLFIFASKSGGTLEIQSVLKLLTQLYKEQGIDPKSHFVSVTIPGSPLDSSKLFSEVFYMQESVGGRYSVTSMIGVLPLLLVYGQEVVQQFLEGAHQADKVSLEEDIWKNPSLMDALLSYFNIHHLNKTATLIAPYSQDLRRLTAHFQQLFMESNSKQIDFHGRWISKSQPIVFGEPLTCAQHSFYQGIHQGTFYVDMTAIGFMKTRSKVDRRWDGLTNQERLNANLFAQMVALAQGKSSENPNRHFFGGRSSRALMFEQLDARATGYLLGHYEAKTIFYGFLIEVNSFDQEGVQLGKALANEAIEKMKQGISDPLMDLYLKGV